MVIAWLLWTFVAALPAGQTPAPALPRVYITTAVRGAEADLRDRQQSVKDLRSALAGKKKDLVLVDTDDADYIIDVVDRSFTVPKIAFMPPPRPGQPGIDASPARAVHLRVALRHGTDDPIDFTNKSTYLESGGGWKAAADEIAKQIDKWLVDRRTTPGVISGTATAGT
jgi:hypothetical protein